MHFVNISNEIIGKIDSSSMIQLEVIFFLDDWVFQKTMHPPTIPIKNKPPIDSNRIKSKVFSASGIDTEI